LDARIGKALAVRPRLDIPVTKTSLVAIIGSNTGDGASPGDAIACFHTADGTAYADVYTANHRETLPIRGDRFRRFIRSRVFAQTRSPPAPGLLKRILDHFEAEAEFGGEQREVFLRVGQQGGRVYLDLADPDWRVVEVDADGWRVVKDAPVRFRRTPRMLPLPISRRGGSVEELADLLNVQSRADLILIVSFLLAALRGIGPFPVLAVWGEQGSAKSTLVRMLRALVDPNAAPLRSLPTTERDLFVGAEVNFIQAYDNISSINPTISDALCRLATGGAFASRQFFKNRGEVAVSAMRPTILNGISNVIHRADLADRSVSISLESVAEGNRRAEIEVMAEFEGARPRILGVLLDAVSRGLKELPQVKTTGLARMADFDLWIRACEPALWPAESFRQAYTSNRNEAAENSLEADAVAATLRDFATAHGEWRGTAAELLHLLGQHADHAVRGADKDWPKSPERLRHRLDRAAPNLRKVGIEITHARAPDRNRTRLITISAVAQEAGGNRPNRPDRPNEADQARAASDGSDGRVAAPSTTDFGGGDSRHGQPQGRPSARLQRGGTTAQKAFADQRIGRIIFKKRPKGKLDDRRGRRDSPF